MRITLLTAAVILVVLPVAFGQHGTARNLQNGSLHDTWLGIVASTNDATREITLASGGGESDLLPPEATLLRRYRPQDRRIQTGIRRQDELLLVLYG